MTDHLEALPEEKRLNILDACLDEFSEHGYTGASTNRIVQAAGISKGLLFHYFGSKKKLFLFVLDHSIHHMMKLMSQYRGPAGGDIFETLALDAEIKLRVAAEAPRMYRILFDVYVNLPDGIKNELMERYGQLFEAKRGQLFEHMDLSRLREGVTADMVVTLISDFLSGYYQRRLSHFKTLSPEQLLEEIDDIKDEVMKYLEMIKESVYKDE